MLALLPAAEGALLLPSLQHTAALAPATLLLLALAALELEPLLGGFGDDGVEDSEARRPPALPLPSGGRCERVDMAVRWLWWSWCLQWR